MAGFGESGSGPVMADVPGYDPTLTNGGSPCIHREGHVLSCWRFRSGFNPIWFSRASDFGDGEDVCRRFRWSSVDDLVGSYWLQRSQEHAQL